MAARFSLTMKTVAALVMFLLAPVVSAVPRDALPLDAVKWPGNYRLHVEFSASTRATLHWPDGPTMELPEGGSYDIAVERPAQGEAVLRVWSGVKLLRGPEEVKGLKPLSRPLVEAAAGATVTSAWVQELERSDHGELVAGWNP